jgi:hypothetical protein
MITQEEYEEAQELVWDYEDQLKEQGKALDTSEEPALNIDLVSKLFLFKVQDYTTELIGRYNEEKDCYYVQGGDGSKYEYDSDRVVWKRELNVC